MNKITVALIKHLTISDLLCLFFLALPALSAYVCGTCVFGSWCTMCYYTSFTRPALTSANFKFVLLISAHRLYRCYRPHSAMTLQPVLIEIIAVVVYAISLLETALTYFAIRDSNFNYNLHGCYADVARSSAEGIIARFIHFSFVLFLPFVGTIVTNVLLWAIACRASHKFDLKPLITVSVISGLILVSWLPFIVYVVRKYILRKAFDYATAEEAAFNLILLSLCSNPVVYTVFNKSLLAFLQVGAPSQSYYHVFTYIADSVFLLRPLLQVKVRRLGRVFRSGQVAQLNGQEQSYGTYQGTVGHSLQGQVTGAR